MDKYMICATVCHVRCPVRRSAQCSAVQCSAIQFRVVEQTDEAPLR